MSKDMDLIEANRVIEAAFPMQGVTIQQPGGPTGTFKVVRANGEIIGQAFNLTAALRQACKPVLDAARARALEVGKEREKEFVLFMSFLRERFNDEFVAYREAHESRAEAASGDPSGPEHDQARLVSELP